MKKYLFLLWIMILSFSTASAQYNQSMTSLQEMITAVDAICPINCGQGLTLSSLKLNKQAKLVTMTIKVNSEYFSIDNINSQKENIATNIINNWAVNETLSSFIKDMANSGSSVKVLYIDERSNKSTDVIIPNSKIKNTVSSDISQAENSERLLQSYLTTERQSVGKEMSPGMLMTGVEDMGSYIVFTFSLDENRYDMNVLASTIDQSIYSVISGLINDPVGKHEMTCFAENGRGVKYVYIGRTSKRKVESAINFEKLYDMTH